jgi:hypothetical protein
MNTRNLSFSLLTTVMAAVFACSSGDERLGAEDDCSPETGAQCAPASATGSGDPECRAQDAQGEGTCDVGLGIKFDGTACVAFAGCECVGADCDALFSEFGLCDAAFAQCCPQTGGCSGSPTGSGGGGGAAGSGGGGVGGSADPECPTAPPAPFTVCRLPAQCCQYATTLCECTNDGNPSLWQCGTSVCQ